MVKVAIYLVAFCLIYSLLLKKDTSYGRNRAFILLSVLTALLLPLLTFNSGMLINLPLFGRTLSEVLISASRSGTAVSTGALPANGVLRIVSIVYFTGLVIFLLKLFIDLFNLLWLILVHRKKGSSIIRFQGFSTAGFSALGYIFINTRLSAEDAGEIINHEKNHLRQNHYLDILFFEFVSAFQWFNPAVFLLNRELRAIHEFQADHDCLLSGIPVVNYQSLLLSQIFKSGSLKLTNSFSNPSLIRKRMIMMTKKPTSALANLKLLPVIPVTAMVFLLISAKPESPVNPSANPAASVAESSELPYATAEIMPVFPGGDSQLLKYLSENTTYPDASRQKNEQGRVIVRFCVTSKGTISQVSVQKSVSPELDKEALRVVNTLPAFIPGRQGGKAVPVWYMVPITFTLK